MDDAVPWAEHFNKFCAALDADLAAFVRDIRDLPDDEDKAARLALRERVGRTFRLVLAEKHGEVLAEMRRTAVPPPPEQPRRRKLDDVPQYI